VRVRQTKEKNTLRIAHGIVLAILFMLSGSSIYAQQFPEEGVVFDSIRIEKNWMTKDKIILRELEFSKGEPVSAKQMETSIAKIWNIGNLVDVDYRIDTLSSDSLLLTIIAKDAFTIVPNISFSGNKEDYVFNVGVSDNNFLGRNISLDIGGSFATYQKNYNFSIGIPRQMLYRNMTLSLSASKGQAQNYRYEEREKVSGIAYNTMQISGSIGNPWHEDYRYVFSPNLGWSYFQHETDTALMSEDVEISGDYNAKYIALSLSESIGIVNRKRHQEDGSIAYLSYGVGIGLNEESPFYQSVSGGAQFHKLFNKVVQFSATFGTAYTTAKLSSLINYRGASDVLGIRTGEISGKGYYAAYVGGHFTYINTKWFALEHRIYANWGNGKDKYVDLYRTEPIFGVGTGLKFMIPTIPWMSINVKYSYTGEGGNAWHIH
jgi:outer membrane protein assembly factor BamA